jgi:diguanylate cyclase
MLKMTSDELRAVIQQLDQAIYNHDQWYKSLDRVLVCHLTPDLRDTEPDSHLHCRFGQWYYRDAPEKLRQHPGFLAVEAEHRRMHQLAGEILGIQMAGEVVPFHAYDNFASALEHLRLEIQSLRRELEDSLSGLDALTGAHNRVGMLPRLREFHELVRRSVQPCSIAIMDLDHFKDVNDRYGHPIGDKVLIASARFLIDHVRPYDRVYRYGGEEFLICLQSTEPREAQLLLERLREGLAENPVDYGAAAPIYVTASFGIASMEAEISVEQSIARADQAVYAAKGAGRNCVRLWQPGMAGEQPAEQAPLPLQ